MTTKQVAEALGTTLRELRVFLRASDDYQAVGSGSRHAFETKDVGPNEDALRALAQGARRGQGRESRD